MGPEVKIRRRQAVQMDLMQLLSYAKPYRLNLAVALMSLMIASGLALAFPQVVRWMIDAAFIEHDSLKLNRAAIMLIGVFAAQSVFSFLRSYLLSYTGERIIKDIRIKLYAHLINLPQAFFADRHTGEFLSRLTSDVSIVQSVVTSSLTDLLRQGLILSGAVVILTVSNPRLTLLMLIIVPVVVVSVRLYGHYVRRISTRVQDHLADASSVLEETLSGIRIVQSFVREDHELKRYGQKLGNLVQLAARRSLAAGGFIALIVFVVFSSMGLVLWFGARMVIAGQLTVGGLTAFVLYTFVVAHAISGIAELYGQFQQAIGATRRVFELLNTKLEICDPKNPQVLKNVSGDVRLKDVHFTYPDERGLAVLKGVSISARSGEVVALVGPSGGGKSTLVSLIPRFYDVSSGAILLDGHDIRTLRLRQLREAIGIVPQETALFSGTILENIAYGKLDATTAEIEQAARVAHAHGFIVGFREGYNTIVGERGLKLSGGQRQRIAIARALLKNPAILILDEATNSLDSESEQLVQDALEKLMKGRTTFVIAHRLSTVRRADRIVVLNHGLVVEEGTHERLLANYSFYKQLHDIQFNGHSPRSNQDMQHFL